MTSVMQPTGVYKNLNIGPVAAYPSAQTPSASASVVQPAAQNPQVQTPIQPVIQPSAGDVQNNPPKKKSHTVLFCALAFCAVVAGLFVGMPALGRRLDSMKAKKVIESMPFNCLKSPLRAVRKALVSFGDTMDKKGKNFREHAQDIFDYFKKWHSNKKEDAAS